MAPAPPPLFVGGQTPICPNVSLRLSTLAAFFCTLIVALGAAGCDASEPDLTPQELLTAERWALVDFTATNAETGEPAPDGSLDLADWLEFTPSGAVTASNRGSVQTGTYELSEDGTTLSVDDPLSPDLDILRLDRNRFHYRITFFGMRVVARYDHSEPAPRATAAGLRGSSAHKGLLGIAPAAE